MKIIILGGFLGSGKTSVLMQLAKAASDFPDESKTTVAIIENEIGDVSIDTKMLSSYQIKELFSGCICCTLAGDLTSCANEIEEKYGPDYLFIEATGMAHPSNVLDIMKRYAKSKDSIKMIVLADASRWDDLMDYMDVFISNQLKGSDIILLNKCDLVSAEETKQIVSEIQVINDTAKIIPICAKEKLGSIAKEILKYE